MKIHTSTRLVAYGITSYHKMLPFFLFLLVIEYFPESLYSPFQSYHRSKHCPWILKTVF